MRHETIFAGKTRIKIADSITILDNLAPGEVNFAFDHG